MVNFGLLSAEICLLVWGHNQQISTGFASWQHYCSDVAGRKPIKLCTAFGRLLGWYITYTFSGVLAPLRNFARCKTDFAFKSCALVYWQHYCMALQQRASAKLCGVEHRTPPIFGRATITVGNGPYYGRPME